jgi:hypothetical protein
MTKIFLPDEIKAVARDFVEGTIPDEEFVSRLLRVVGRDDDSLAAHAAWMIAGTEGLLSHGDSPDSLDRETYAAYAQTLAIRHAFAMLLGVNGDEKIQNAVAQCKIQIPAHAYISADLPLPLHPRIVYCAKIGEVEVPFPIFSDAALAALSHTKEVIVRWRDGTAIAKFVPDPNEEGKKWTRIKP